MNLSRFSPISLSMALSAVMLLAFTYSPATHAQESKTDKAVIKDVTRWKYALRTYNKNFVIVDGKAYANPYFDPKHMNSNHTNTSQWTKDNTEKLEFEGPRVSWIKSEQLVPPKEEVLAQSKALQGFAPGHYGYIESATIDDKVGENGLVLKNIVLTNEEAYKKAQAKDQASLDAWEESLADQAMEENIEKWKRRKALNRGPGYSQRKQAAKQIMDVRYKERSKLIHLQQSMADSGVILLDVPNKVYSVGKTFNKRSLLQIVIVDFDQERGMPVAIPATSFKSGLSEDELLKLLADRNVSPDVFSEVVELKKKSDPLEARIEILETLGFSGYSNKPGGKGKILGSTSVGGVSDDGRPRGMSEEEWEEEKEKRKRWRDKWRNRNND